MHRLKVQNLNNVSKVRACESEGSITITFASSTVWDSFPDETVTERTKLVSRLKENL